MKILGLESSAKAASVALSENGTILARSAQCMGLTHSRTLLPMAEDLLKNCGVALSDVDAIAVAAGPGSFTGLRIGISAAKGLAFAADKPCCGVSTLFSMALPLAHLEQTVIVCAMDARRNQVYNALFLADGGTLTRLCPDRAVALSTVVDALSNDGRKKIIVGDGATLCYNAFSENGIICSLAPSHLRMQDAIGVCFAAERSAAEGGLISASQLLPVYLRLSQAERERLAKENSGAK